MIPVKIQNYLTGVIESSHWILKHRHAACIVDKRLRIVTSGRNQPKTHPEMLRLSGDQNKQFLHAEVDALLKFIRQYDPSLLDKMTLYVIRANKDGDFLLSKPCEICQKMIDFHGVKVIHS